MSWASWTRPYVPEEEGKEVNHGRMGWKEWRMKFLKMGVFLLVPRSPVQSHGEAW